MKQSNKAGAKTVLLLADRVKAFGRPLMVALLDFWPKLTRPDVNREQLEKFEYSPEVCIKYNQRVTAAEYIKNGWSPIPLKFRGKEPVPSEWKSLSIGLDDIDRWFPADQPQNIGVILGDDYSNLVVVDLVDKDAIPFAKEFMPETAIFGPASRIRSKLLYRCTDDRYGDGNPPPSPHPCEFGAMDVGTIVEVHSDGELMVFPGSSLGPGGPITFENRRTAHTVEWHKLEPCIAVVAIATVLYKLWIRGDRRSLAINTAKFLRRSNWKQPEIETLIARVAKEAGDQDVEGHLEAIHTHIGIQTNFEALRKSGRSGLCDIENWVEVGARWSLEFKYTDPEYNDPEYIDLELYETAKKILEKCRNT